LDAALALVADDVAFHDQERGGSAGALVGARKGGPEGTAR
jgi:hypothetical protein